MTTKKNGDLVSIVVPIYKTEKYLEQCLQSLQNQTYSNIEVLLIDDGSPDNCPKICDEWCNKDSRFKVMHNKNQGLLKSRIEGIKRATGDYICFVDSDDYVEKDYVKFLINEIRADGVDLCQCGCYRLMNDKLFISRYCKSNKTYEQGKDFDCAVELLDNKYNLYNACWNKIFKKDKLLKIIEFLDPSIRMGEDLNLVYAYLCLCNKVRLISNNLYVYRLNKNSISYGNYKKYFDQFKVIDQMTLISNNFNTHNRVILYYLQSFVFSGIYECLKSDLNKNDFNEFLDDEHILYYLNNYKTRDILVKMLNFSIKHKKRFLIKIFLKIYFRLHKSKFWIEIKNKD